MNHSWGTIEKITKDRQKWKTFVAALHDNGIPGSKQVSIVFFKKASEFSLSCISVNLFLFRMIVACHW